MPSYLLFINKTQLNTRPTAVGSHGRIVLGEPHADG